MINKQDFVRYVEIFDNFEEYLKKLDAVNVKLWEEPSCGWFRDAYVAAICQLIDVEIDLKYENALEQYLFDDKEFRTRTPEEFYDWLTS